MNVIFLDFDGVLDTYHYKSNEDVENKIAILAKICSKYDCKIVIEAAAKDAIDEKTFEVESEWVEFILKLLKKYNIEFIGRTPNVKKRMNNYSYFSMWKEDEIRLYLFRHPEIDHYCVIDDDDYAYAHSDLNKVRNHLVTTIFYDEDYKKEGLLESHSEEVGKILQKDNEIKKYALTRKKYALPIY